MNMDHFNELKPAELERLAVLIEECAEVVQIGGKILRHGYNSTHPDDPEGDTNREMLEKELGHIRHSVDRMAENLDVDRKHIAKSAAIKSKAITVYLHHQ